MTSEIGSGGSRTAGLASELPFLAGLSVVEHGDGIAGAWATATLAALGADVTTVRDRDGLMRRRAPGFDQSDGNRQSLLAAILDADKAVATGAGPTLPDPRLTVVDRCEGSGSLAEMPVDAYRDDVARTNRAVWVTISPYGLLGSCRGWRGTELTIAAAGGLLAMVSDASTHKPMKLAGNQALQSAGQVAALAACHGLDEFARTGNPVHVDVSAQEAVILTGPMLQLTHLLMNSVGAAGSRRYGVPAGFYRCRDGLVRISVMENHQWDALVRAIGSPDWASAYSAAADRRSNADLVNERLEQALSTWSIEECESRLQAEGVPAAAMYGPADLLKVPHFSQRDAFRDIPVGPRTVRAIRSPFRGSANSSSGTAPIGLAQLRVTEISHVLAAPLAGALLGAMGANVTKIEDPDRLDMYRRQGPYVDNVAGLDRGAYFVALNHSKASRVVALTAQPRLLDEQLAQTDVLLENLGQRRARRLGVDSATLAQTWPHILGVSSSGFGHTGPWSAYRAYAYNLQTAGGLAHLTRSLDDEPADVDVPWADLISGVALATVIAAWAVAPQPRPAYAVDFSMIDLVVQRLGEFVAAASAGLNDQRPESGSNQVPPFAPSGVYATSVQGRLLALSVSTDREWAQVCAALGCPDVLMDEQFSTAASRLASHRLLDAALSEALSGVEVSATVANLQDHGVAASMVMTTADLAADAHLAERELFASVTHPQWGTRRIVGLPWRLVGRAPIALRPPPELRLPAVGDTGMPARRSH